MCTWSNELLQYYLQFSSIHMAVCSSVQETKDGPFLFISPGSVNQYESMNYPEARDFENQSSVYPLPPHVSALHAQDSASSTDRAE